MHGLFDKRLSAGIFAFIHHRLQQILFSAEVAQILLLRRQKLLILSSRDRVNSLTGHSAGIQIDIDSCLTVDHIENKSADSEYGKQTCNQRDQKPAPQGTAFGYFLFQGNSLPFRDYASIITYFRRKAKRITIL